MSYPPNQICFDGSVFEIHGFAEAVGSSKVRQ